MWSGDRCYGDWDEDGWNNNSDPSIDFCQEFYEDECLFNERCIWDNYWGCYGIDWDDNGFILGDLNIDYLHDVTDVTRQVNIIVDNHNPSGYEIWAADINIDISINILDVIELSNIILGISRISNVLEKATANLYENTLYVFGDVAGIQLDGEIISSIKGKDAIITANGKTLVYNLQGALDTKRFTFLNSPSNLLVSSSNAESVYINKTYPDLVRLNDVYPNPFNPFANISFQLLQSSSVNISIYDLRGKKIDTIINSKLDLGYHNFSWDASNYSNGMYLLKMKSGNYIETQKLILLK